MTPPQSELLNAVATIRQSLASRRTDEVTKARVGQSLSVILDESRLVPGGWYVRDNLGALRHCVRTIYSAAKSDNTKAKQRADECLSKIETWVKQSIL